MTAELHEQMDNLGGGNGATTFDIPPATEVDIGDNHPGPPKPMGHISLRISH